MRTPPFFTTVPFLLFSLLVAGRYPASAREYDPMKAISEVSPAAPCDLTVTDAKRKRDIPIRVYLPATTSPAPVILFSHGLGGSREGSSFLGKHWASRGYVAVFLQHPGSDESVWMDTKPAERMRAMQRAANGENLRLRTDDVPAVLNQLTRWNGEKGHPVAGRMDLKHVGMSGHSFGAVTTQAVSGQAMFGGQAVLTDPRIQAAAVFSPSERRGGDVKKEFGTVKIPWLLMTGTEDVAPIGNIDVASRLSVYPALPPGDKYELVLDGAQHSVFSDPRPFSDAGKRNPNHKKAILALTTAFWDAYLRNDAGAKSWLKGAGPKSVLEKKDRWQAK